MKGLNGSDKEACGQDVGNIMMEDNKRRVEWGWLRV